jgi:hypothetical protein
LRSAVPPGTAQAGFASLVIAEFWACWKAKIQELLVLQSEGEVLASRLRV